MIRLAPAKLNLTLAVLGRRPDGYHDLHSVMVPLALADRLSVARAAAGHDTLRVDGLDAGPIGRQPRPPGDRRRPGRRGPRGRLVPAGGAPGEADPGRGRPRAAGAATPRRRSTRALEAWGLQLPGGPPDADVAALRAAVAARVGSDVPFFLAGGPALVEGRGERVQPLAADPGDASPGVLLVTPAVPASTPAVFAAFDGGWRGGRPPTRARPA